MKQFLLILLLFPLAALAQLSDSTSIINISANSINTIRKNINDLSGRIEKKTNESLQRLQKQEDKLKKIFAKKDSVAAKQLFNVDEKYKALASKIKSATSVKGLNEYIPSLDSLNTGFRFLQQAENLKSKFPKEWSAKVGSVNKNIDDLKSKLQSANEIRSFIKERKQQIKVRFERYGLTKHLKKYNKQAYYYSQQLNEYKAMLHDPKKVQQRLITELRKLPAFNEFMKKHSQLASLFRLPEDYGSVESLAGLQTRALVQQQLQQRFGSSTNSPPAAGSATGFLQQQMSLAQSELNKLKDKVNKIGGGTDELDMPDFKPNTQKTKSFLKRIEYGANVQSQKTNGLLPVTSDLALTAGYKLNDKSIIGLGAAYKLGWGNGWQHIRLTHEGLGLRSYIDYKIKGNFWITGGYEQNYQHSFTKIDQLKTYNAWQTSGLIGLSKKYKLGKKTNNLQLLWDFMSYQQIPQRQPVLFRVGFGF